jgi:tetratricopeptide (TPR) repeat protein
VQKSPDQMDAMGQISKKSALTRANFISYLKGDKLMRELCAELAEDPGLHIYNREQRTRIISHWIRWGDKEAASDFIGENEELLNNVWWLRSLLYEGRAEYIKAVETIRDSLEAPKKSSVYLDKATIVKLKRECVLSPNDLSKVRPLLDYYITDGSYENALSLLERMLEFDQLPSDLIYWRAQCLYHVEDYVDSWLAFEAYLKLLWGE